MGKDSLPATGYCVLVFDVESKNRAGWGASVHLTRKTMTKFEKTLMILAAILITAAFISQVIIYFDDKHLKEMCLSSGGTAVEYPKGTFERCIK